MRTILDVKANPRHTRIAATYALLLLGVSLALLPVATRALPKMAVMMPAYQTAIGLIGLQTALLLLLQFRQSRRTTLVILSAAFAFNGFMALLQMFLFPGIVGEAVPVNMSTEVPARIWLYANVGFPLLVALALLPGGRSSLVPDVVEVRHVRLWSFLALGAPLFAGLLLAISATYDLSWQPVGMNGASNYSWLIDATTAWTCFALNVAVFFGLLLRTGLRRRFELWLAVALLGVILYLGLSFVAGDRYTVAWYGARLIQVITAASVLGVLMFEIHVLYTTMARLSVGLREQATRDSLTKVFTRRFFDRRFAEELRRDDRPLTLMMFDIDHFKTYNDRFGHQAGDQCLIAVAREVESQVNREGQFIARYGGEEFALVLPGLGLERAHVLAETLRRSVETLGLVAEAGLSREVTISIGVACVFAGASPASEDVIGVADAALYDAKTAGRNCVRVRAVGPAAPRFEARLAGRLG